MGGNDKFKDIAMKSALEFGVTMSVSIGRCNLRMYYSASSNNSFEYRILNVRTIREYVRLEKIVTRM